MSNPVSASCSDWCEKENTKCQGDLPPAGHDRLHDEHYLKMFQRALQQNDQCAKEEFQRHFSAAVLGWLRLHPRRKDAHRYKKEEYYLLQAFESFWQVTIRHKALASSTLTIVLQYLQASLNGVITDTLRNYSGARQVEMPAPASRGEFTALPDLKSDELWKNLQALFIDTREQRIAYLLFHCGLEPREIVQAYPEEFSDVQEIFRLRHNVIERLLITI